MLMKWRSRFIALALVGYLLSSFLGVSSALVQNAYAAPTDTGGSAGSTQQLVYTYNPDQVNDLKSIFKNQTHGQNDSLANTAIFVRGGIFGDKPFRLDYNSASTDAVTQTGDSFYEFHGTYSCGGNGFNDGPHKITVAALTSLGDNFDSTQLFAQVYITDADGRHRDLGLFPPGTTGGDQSRGLDPHSSLEEWPSSLPASCIPAGADTHLTKQEFKLGNFNKLPAAEQASWTGVADATPNNGGSSQNDDQCAQLEGALAWIFCPLIKSADNVIGQIINHIILPELQADPQDISPQNPLFQVWNSLRTLANVAFILIFLVIIFANTLSLNVDAYAVKKVLPRLVAAALLVQFSFLLSAIMIDISNVLGGGVEALINTAITGHFNAGPAHDMAASQGALHQALIIGGAGVGLIALFGVPTIMLFAVLAVIAILTIFFTLVLRKLIIAVCLVASPLAFAAMVLPGTERFFKMWYTNFIRALIMYPLIVLFLATGNIMADVSGSASNGGASNQILELVGAAFPIIVFFAIPSTFAMAGGIMGSVAGRLSQRGKQAGSAFGGSQFLKDARQKRQEAGLMQAQSGKVLGVPAGFVGRGLGRIKSGNALPTAASNRRLTGAYNKLREEQTKDLQTRFAQDFDLNNAGDRQKLVDMANGKRVSGFENNEITRHAALKHLQDGRRYDELRQIRSGMKGSTDARVWRAFAQDDYKDLAEKAPDLLANVGAPASFGSFANMTPERLAGMHASTIDATLKHIQSLQAAHDPEGDRLAEGFARSLQAMTKDNKLKGKFDIKAVDHLNNNKALFRSTTLTDSSGNPITGEQFLNNAIDPTTKRFN
jgi:hypothetical protein